MRLIQGKTGDFTEPFLPSLLISVAIAGMREKAG